MEYYIGKIVVVTGGSDGIGKALVTQLIELGTKVATCGRDATKLAALQSQYPKQVLMTQALDIQSKEDCQSFISNVVQQFGGIDILINNAGISMRGLFEDTDIETLEKLMNINFWGTVYCCKYALPYLKERKGTIVGVSSIAGYRGLPGRSGYSASKYALNGWLESIRVELQNDIHVMWVCPGFTASNIRHSALDEKGNPDAKSLMEEGKMMTAETCATEIMLAIRKKKRNLILTFQGKEAVFMNRFFPSWTDKLIRKFYFKKNQLIK